MQIKILHKQGKSLRAIACETGCSVNTVRKYLAGEAAPKYRDRVARKTKIAGFEEYVRQRVAAAAPDWIPATVLWRELQERGFAGGERTVRKLVATLRPRRPDDPLARFETEPGDQMQADWIEFRRRKGDSLYAFVATSGYSRASYVEFVSDMRLETLLACHSHCFEWFGGAPHRALYDNMKTADNVPAQWARLWIVPENVHVKASDGIIVVDSVKMLVKARRQVPDSGTRSGLRGRGHRGKRVRGTLRPAVHRQLPADCGRIAREIGRVSELAKAIGLARNIERPEYRSTWTESSRSSDASEFRLSITFRLLMWSGRAKSVPRLRRRTAHL